MKKNVFVRASALALALITACSALPFGARAVEMSASSTEEFEAAYT